MKLVPMTKGSDFRDSQQAVPRNEVCTLRLSSGRPRLSVCREDTNRAVRRGCR